MSVWLKVDHFHVCVIYCTCILGSAQCCGYCMFYGPSAMAANHCYKNILPYQGSQTVETVQ